MATPRFVPVAPLERARPIDFAGIPPARRKQPRAGEVLHQPRARGFGVPCPDGGYALLLLAREVAGDFVLAAGEQREDAVSAVATVAMHRAGVVGRAPVTYDILFASALLAYDDPDALECAVLRARLLSGVAHDPDLRQWLSDAVNSAAEVSVRSTAEAIATWRCTVLADPRSRRTWVSDHRPTFGRRLGHAASPSDRPLPPPLVSRSVFVGTRRTLQRHVAGHQDPAERVGQRSADDEVDLVDGPRRESVAFNQTKRRVIERVVRALIGSTTGVVEGSAWGGLSSGRCTGVQCDCADGAMGTLSAEGGAANGDGVDVRR